MRTFMDRVRDALELLARVERLDVYGQDRDASRDRRLSGKSRIRARRSR